MTQQTPKARLEEIADEIARLGRDVEDILPTDDPVAKSVLDAASKVYSAAKKMP